MPFSSHPGDSALIVDDVPENLAMLCDALDAAGYMVLVATNGSSALERLRHITPDVVLLDAVMPGMDGFQTCERIKANPAWAALPVIFMTGLTDTKDVVRGFAAGGVDYVTKPLDPDVVIARVAAHVQNARLLQQARDAIDSTREALVIVDGRGAPVWWSRAARDLAQRIDPAPDAPGALLAALRPWLLRCIERMTQAGAADPEMGRHPGTLNAHFQGMVARDQYLIRLSPAEPAPQAVPLAQNFGLTQREREVLEWLAKGKTNRDIADILGLSPRTVDKHLEHIYIKLGVETRTAAAALLHPPRVPEPEAQRTAPPKS